MQNGVWPPYDAIQSRKKGSKLQSDDSYKQFDSMAEEATLVAAAGLLARIEALKPPELHCSSMTISCRNFGNSASLFGKISVVVLPPVRIGAQVRRPGYSVIIAVVVAVDEHRINGM